MDESSRFFDLKKGFWFLVRCLFFSLCQSRCHVSLQNLVPKFLSLSLITFDHSNSMTRKCECMYFWIFMNWHCYIFCLCCIWHYFISNNTSTIKNNDYNTEHKFRARNHPAVGKANDSYYKFDINDQQCKNRTHTTIKNKYQQFSDG